MLFRGDEIISSIFKTSGRDKGVNGSTKTYGSSKDDIHESSNKGSITTGSRWTEGIEGGQREDNNAFFGNNRQEESYDLPLKSRPNISIVFKNCPC